MTGAVGPAAAGSSGRRVRGTGAAGLGIIRGLTGAALQKRSRDLHSERSAAVMSSQAEATHGRRYGGTPGVSTSRRPHRGGSRAGRRPFHASARPWSPTGSHRGRRETSPQKPTSTSTGGATERKSSTGSASYCRRGLVPPKVRTRSGSKRSIPPSSASLRAASSASIPNETRSASRTSESTDAAKRLAPGRTTGFGGASASSHRRVGKPFGPPGRFPPSTPRRRLRRIDSRTKAGRACSGIAEPPSSWIGESGI